MNGSGLPSEGQTKRRELNQLRAEIGRTLRAGHPDIRALTLLLARVENMLREARVELLELGRQVVAPTQPGGARPAAVPNRKLLSG